MFAMHHIQNFSVLYVSATLGNDRYYNGLSFSPDNFGNGPFATLKKAFEAVRELRRTGVARPLTIALMEDTFLPAPIAVEREHYAVTLTSFGVRRRLIGGVAVTGWKRDVFQGVSCFSAVLPPKKDGTRWEFTDLFVNGKRADLTRYPKTGTLDALDTENNLSTYFDSSKWFVAKKEDLAGVEGLSDAIVNFYQYWVDAHTPIESYDPETGKLIMEYASRMSMHTVYGKGENAGAFHYYLTNVPGTFGEKNQWYLDRHAGIVYYIPEDECVVPDAIEVYAPVIPHFFTISTEDFHISNLELMCTCGDYASRVDYDHTTEEFCPNEEAAYASDAQSVCWAPGSVIFENAARSSISDCYIHDVGIHGVEIKTGCHGIRVERNHIEDVCAGGIKIYGGAAGHAPETMTTGCILRDNIITRCGRRYAAGCGILVAHSGENEISGNHISHMDYSGISVGWVWGYAPSSTYGNRICNNHIHHVGQGKLADLGGIYLLGRQQGTIVSGNRIHDIQCFNYGGWGIYLDEGSSYVRIENNVVYNTQSESIFLHGGHDNVARNNIFAFGSSCILANSTHVHSGLLVEHNILVTNQNPVYQKSMVLHTVASSHNLVYDVSDKAPVWKEDAGRSICSLEEWNVKYGKDIDSVIADPLFRDLSAFDFTLLPNSPALQIGFSPIRGFPAESIE